MTPQEIANEAEKHRHIEPGMNNWKMMINDAWVMLRELAKRVAELEERDAGGTGKP